MVKKRFKDNKPAKSAEEVLKEKLDGAEKEIGKLSHSKKKKLDKKLRFLEKLHKTEKEIGAAKKPLVRKKKKKGATLNSMDALAEALPTLNLVAKKTGGPTPVAPRATKVATNSQRSRVLKKETVHLSAVLDHPIFKADPLAAVTRHLSNTLPPPPERKRPLKSDKGGGKKKKKKGAAEMEM